MSEAFVVKASSYFLGAVGVGLITAVTAVALSSRPASKAAQAVISGGTYALIIVLVRHGVGQPFGSQVRQVAADELPPVRTPVVAPGSAPDNALRNIEITQ